MMGKSHEEWMIEQLRESPGFAVELLRLAIEDNIPEELAIVMRQITAAGYDVAVTPKPKPAARKRTRPVAAKAPKPKRPSVGRSRTRRAAAVVA